MTNFKLCAALAAIPAMGCATDATNPPDQTVATSPATATPGTPKTWRGLDNAAPFAQAGAPHLLNDGRLVIQEYGTNHWFALTPDQMGSYSAGTWSQLASTPQIGANTGNPPPFPIPYSPLFYASAVLPDGRLIIEGGEYDGISQPSNPGFSVHGAIYDPAADKWTSIAPPTGWNNIGDASGVLLADGRFLLSDCCDDGGRGGIGGPHAPLAILDPTNLTWQGIPTAETTKESDRNDEESWAMLPDNTILTIDALNSAKPTESERFDPTTGNWTSAGSTIVPIADNQISGASFEEGPIMLRQDGKVFAIGTTANTASFDTHTSTWTAGPTMPKNASNAQLGSKDGPGVVMPNGTMMVALSPAPLGNETFPVGVEFFEFDGTTFTAVPGTPNAVSNGSYQENFIVLPTGEVLITEQSADIQIYTPSPGYFANSQPILTSAPRLVSTAEADPLVPEYAHLDTSMDAEIDAEIDSETGLRRALLPLATIHPGRTYKVAGSQLSGLTQGSYYGDDQQSYTNRPIFRVTSMATGHVRYLNSHHASNYGVTPGMKSTAFFDVPADTEPGVSTLEVVASGTASAPIVVNIK